MSDRYGVNLFQTSVGEVKMDHDTVNKVTCGMTVSIQMPFDIREINCPTHKTVIKVSAILKSTW